MAQFNTYTLTRKLRSDGEFALWRGRGPNAEPVLIQTPLSGRISSDSRRRMEHEYALRNELDGAWAVRPLGWAFAQGRRSLVFEDPGGEPLDRTSGEALPVPQVLSIGIALAEALTRVHGAGLIHKDLRPANVLISASEGAHLTGFGIATHRSASVCAGEPSSLSAASLPYMAPEQTGRMRCAVDSRSDLYALGVTLYELLTGVLPFSAADPMEWIHCHLARTPPTPSERVRGVAPAVSAIVMKLLAKTMEERYQTAATVSADLQRCQLGLELSGDTAVATHPSVAPSGRLSFSDRLYGRAPELEALQAAFARVSKAGATELVLVSGGPGVGKSALVCALQKAIGPRGLFVGAKFDQYKRDSPYSTIAQGLSVLMQRILGGSDEALAGWREAMKAALGGNARVLAELIPELEFVLGPSPPLAELSPKEAQNRFHTSFRCFVGSLAGTGCPLVLFLDDLQWLDLASLHLIEHLLTHASTRHLLIVGTYRDAEVRACDTLMVTLDGLRSRTTRVTDLALAPLSAAQVTELVADAVHSSPARAAPLARLVHDKTGGNPFFTIHFLSLLHDEGLLTFDAWRSAWRWHVERIAAKDLTDNVVDLMVSKLERLPVATRDALKHLACLGSRAALERLALVLGRAGEAAGRAIEEAVYVGVLVRDGGDVRFVHDRLLEAAYALIPPGQRLRLHLRIGRLLLSSCPQERVDERVFEIVNQLNQAVALIVNAAERAQLYRLNLSAGRKAKAATAWAAARDYFAHGVAVAGEDEWELHHVERFQAELDLAECDYLIGNREAADRAFDGLLVRARTKVELARVHRMCMALYQLSGRFDDAIAVALSALALFGVTFPCTPHEIEAAVEAETLQVANHRGGRGIAELADAPEVSDPEQAAVIGLTAEAAGLAFIARPALFPLLVLKALNLLLQHGNTVESSVAYGNYARLLVSRFGDIPAGFAHSQMALGLIERWNDRGRRGRILFNHALFIDHWQRPISSAQALLERGFGSCLESGNFTYAAYCGAAAVWCSLEAGMPLDNVAHAAAKYAEFARQSGNDTVYRLLCVQQQFVSCLKGLTSDPTRFDDARFSENESIEALRNSNFGSGLAFCYILKLVAAFLADQFRVALDWADKAGEVLDSVTAQPAEATFVFYRALARAAIYDQVEAAQRHELLAGLAGDAARLQVWGRHCPENYGARHALVAAELARLRGADAEAMTQYEAAIRSADGNGIVHVEGLASELAGRFYLVRDYQTIASAYLSNARDCYERWGADGKVRQLGRLCPTAGAASPGTTPIALDQLSIAKAAQAVSSELGLDRLIERLMRIAVEHAGAERGALILQEGGEHRVAAEATTRGDDIQVTIHSGAAVPASLVMSIVVYVARTGETVLVYDAVQSLPYANDPYVRQARPRSILCLPLVKQATVVGVLYLENRLVPGVFTADRVGMLELLSAQAAVALENAKLYSEVRRHRDHLEELVQQRTSDFNKTLTELQLILENAALGIVHFVDTAGGGVIQRMNRAAECMLGCAADEMVGQSARELFSSEENYRDFRAMHADVMRDGKAVRSDWHYRKRDGRELVVDLVGCALDPEEMSKGVVWLLDDVTERRRIEGQMLSLNADLQKQSGALRATVAQLERAKQEAEEARAAAVAADVAKSRFLAAASHDLRQPLHALDLYLGFMDDCELPAPVRASLVSARQCAHTMGDLFGALLDISKLDSGVIQPTASVIAVAGVLEQAAVHFEPQARAKGLRLRVARTRARVVADPAMLARILSNLVSNAVQHTERGGVLLGCRRVGAQVRIAVYDTGCGIAPDKQRAVFDEFVQLGNPERDRGKGLGLGLAIVERLARLLGATTVVASRERHGSMFGIELPSTELPMPWEAPVSALEKGSLAGTSVVMVDDESIIVDATRALLGRWGCRVIAASCGREAMVRLAESGCMPDVLMCDYRLRDKENGVDVVNNLRDAVGRSVPALLITGDTAPERLREINSSGLAVLHKPIEPETLKTMLCRLVGR